MSKVHIWADLSEKKLQAYEQEAKRLGVTVESLLEKMVNRLLREEEEKLEECDHPIIPT